VSPNNFESILLQALHQFHSSLPTRSRTPDVFADRKLFLKKILIKK